MLQQSRARCWTKLVQQFFILLIKGVRTIENGAIGHDTIIYECRVAGSTKGFLTQMQHHRPHNMKPGRSSPTRHHSAVREQEALSKFNDALDAQLPTPMNRADSGIGDNLDEADDSPLKSRSTTRKPNELLKFSRQQNLQDNTSAVSQPPASNSRPSTSRSNKPKLSRPLTSSRTPSRGNSRTPPRGSNPPSRRSSVASAQPMIPYNRRAPGITRSITTVYDRTRLEDPFELHQRSKQIFQLYEAPQDNQTSTRQNGRRHLASPSLPELSRMQGACERADPEEGPQPPQYENHVPATIIDWTLPSTRRDQYREIEKSCKGIRGLWRRLAPQWCQRNRRLNFFDDDNIDDVGSVRRYRLDLPPAEEEKGGIEGGKNFKRDEEVKKVKMKWSCLGLRKGV